jgi:diacylglycerol O-acyltransferase / wax synthase
MSAHLKSQVFSPVDATWLRMDRLTNKMMITGVMMFDQPLDFERAKEIIATRMLRHERFRQRVREVPFGLTLPRWEDDPHFDLSAHLHRIALPGPGDMNALQELVSDLMSTPLDYTRPLWDFHIVDNFGEGGAIIGRLHHCIGDGLALVDVLLGMTDEAPEPLPAIAEPKARARDLMGRLGALPAKQSAPSVQKIASSVLQESWRTLRRPAHGIELANQGQELAKEWTKKGSDVVAATGKLLLTLPDSAKAFHGSCSRTKRAAWSEPFPLESVKAIGKRLGGTVNDVLLAAVAGALRRYLEGNDQPTQGVEMNAMVPVNLRQPHEVGELGNRFGLVILTLPVGTRDPVERLVIMKNRMNDIKNSPEALVAYVILNGIGLVPIMAEHLIEDFFVSKTSAVMTNVRGPGQSLYMAGSRLNNLMFWVPVYGNTGMGISIMSYAGAVTVGFATDKCMVPDPLTIAENFNVELREMEGWLLNGVNPATAEGTVHEEPGEPAVTRAAVEETAPDESGEQVLETTAEGPALTPVDAEEAALQSVVEEAGSPAGGDEAEAGEATANKAAGYKADEEAEAINDVGALVTRPGENGSEKARKPRTRQAEVDTDLTSEVTSE